MTRPFPTPAKPPKSFPAPASARFHVRHPVKPKSPAPPSSAAGRTTSARSCSTTTAIAAPSPAYPSANSSSPHTSSRGAATKASLPRISPMMPLSWIASARTPAPWHELGSLHCPEGRAGHDPAIPMVSRKCRSRCRRRLVQERFTAKAQRTPRNAVLVAEIFPLSSPNRSVFPMSTPFPSETWRPLRLGGSTHFPENLNLVTPTWLGNLPKLSLREETIGYGPSKEKWEMWNRER